MKILNFSILIGFLVSLLSLLLLPFLIYFISGLNNFMVIKLAFHLLFGFYGSYLSAQAIGFGVLAALLYYNLKIKVKIDKPLKLGLLGAIYSSITSLFSLCCAPLTITLLGILGSNLTFFLLSNWEKLFLTGLTIQGLSTSLALINLVKTHRLPEKSPSEIYHLKDKPEVKLYKEGALFYAKEGSYKVYRRLRKSEVIKEGGQKRNYADKIIALVLSSLIIFLGTYIYSSPDFEEEPLGGGIEVHVLGPDGRFVKDGIVVNLEGPVKKSLSLNDYIAQFKDLPAGEYRVYINEKEKVFVKLKEGEQVHLFLNYKG
ncbi:hypothetical protein HRbin06_00373 [archaeon HR06]|nr:hypothetical protein HRbin06_00373 [archaeon HR06]